MEYKNLSVEEACRTEIGKLTELGGDGGVIALDAKGNISMEFNTSGMFRGYSKSDGMRKLLFLKTNNNGSRKMKFLFRHFYSPFFRLLSR
jgi:beta-aspartyl-peptidase (threonine type)